MSVRYHGPLVNSQSFRVLPFPPSPQMGSWWESGSVCSWHARWGPLIGFGAGAVGIHQAALWTPFLSSVGILWQRPRLGQDVVLPLVRSLHIVSPAGDDVWLPLSFDLWPKVNSEDFSFLFISPPPQLPGVSVEGFLELQDPPCPTGIDGFSLSSQAVPSLGKHSSIYTGARSAWHGGTWAVVSGLPLFSDFHWNDIPAVVVVKPLYRFFDTPSTKSGFNLLPLHTGRP